MPILLGVAKFCLVLMSWHTIGTQEKQYKAKLALALTAFRSMPSWVPAEFDINIVDF
jgi:hypothetical protein